MTNNQKFYGILVALLAGLAFLVINPGTGDYYLDIVLFYVNAAWIIYSYRKLITLRGVSAPVWLFYGLLSFYALPVLIYQVWPINFTAYTVYALCLSSVLWALHKASGPEKKKKKDRYIPIDNRFS